MINVGGIFMNPESAANLSSILIMVLMFALLYFVFVRPQKKREKKLRDMIAALKVGDEVASIGGIHGKIVRIKDDIFVLESGVGTTKSHIAIERAAISRLIKEGAAKEEEVAPLPDEASQDSAE